MCTYRIQKAHVHKHKSTHSTDVFAYTVLHTHIYIFLHMQQYLYISTVYLYIYIHILTFIDAHAHILMRMRKHVLTNLYVYTALSTHRYFNIHLHTYILPTYLLTNPSPCRAPPSSCFPGGSRAVPTFAVTGGDGDVARPEDLRVASAGGGAAMAVERSNTLNPQQKPENYRTLAPDLFYFWGVWWYCRFKDLK